MMCINVLSKTLSFSKQPTKLKNSEKAAKKTAKNNQNCSSQKKERFLEAQKNNRQTERERERVAQKSTRRETERRDDKTRRRKGEKTLFFPRFSIRFLDFFLS